MCQTKVTPDQPLMPPRAVKTSSTAPIIYSQPNELQIQFAKILETIAKTMPMIYQHINHPNRLLKIQEIAYKLQSCCDELQELQQM